jgi:tripartite-type tricarboxylate transporter receptor subunit TctC
VLAPAGTPRPIINQLSSEIGVMLARPDVKAKFEAFGATPVYSNADQFAAMIKSEIAIYQKVVKAANIRID